MKIKSGLILREVAGNYVVVAVGERAKDFNCMINLNDSGAFLWKKLEQGAEEGELVQALLSEYEVSEEIARKDVQAFIKKMVEAGLVK